MNYKKMILELDVCSPLIYPNHVDFNTFKHVILPICQSGTFMIIICNLLNIGNDL